MNAERKDFDFGYYGLRDTRDGTVFLFDADGGFIGAYKTWTQAANVARRQPSSE